MIYGYFVMKVSKDEELAFFNEPSAIMDTRM